MYTRTGMTIGDMTIGDMTIGDMTIGEIAINADTVRSAVGNSTFLLGLEYVHGGAVASAKTVIRPGQSPRVVGTVRGSRPLPYTVVVTIVEPRRGTPGLVFGSCTCPMHSNCKHVAAVLIAAAGTAGRAGDAGWEASLSAALGVDAGSAAVEQATVALQFDWSRANGGPARLTIRPVTLSPHGRWVRSGISWSELHYYGYATQSQRQEPRRLLKEISALNGATQSGYYYGGRDNTVRLDTFPSARIWDVLAGAAAAGLPLVGSSTGADTPPVLLSAEPAVAGLDVADRDGDWVISPIVTVAGELISGELLLLGDPAHGVAWLPERRRDGTVRQNEKPVHPLGIRLARLDRPLPAGLRPMVGGSAPVVIPPGGRERFLHDFFPLLRRQIAVSSSDGSVQLPRQQPPRLVLSVDQGPSHQLELTWEWLYRVGDAGDRLPLQATGSRTDARDPDAEREALRDVQVAAGALNALCEWGPLGPELAAHVRLSGSDAVRFQRDVLPAIEDLGTVDVEFGQGSVRFREAVDAPVIALAGAAESGTDWFDLTVTITVDGEPVPFRELFVALAGEEEYLILPSGTFFTLDREEFRQLRALIVESRALVDEGGAGLRVSRFQASFWAELERLGVLGEQAAAWGRSVRELADCDGIEEPDLPEGMVATLRPYQQEGFNWLAFLHDHRLGGVLADDMGLGKTVQALALICHAREDKPGGASFLVVAPTSVVGNWAAECRRFAPDLKALAITETAVRRGIGLEEACAGADLVITSYALFRLEYPEYERIGWSGLLLDEAQFIKNHQSKGYQCAKRLPAPFKLVITGTPMENNLMELWTMFSLAAPGLFPDPKHFAEYYRQPIERGGDADRLAQLRRRIRPLMLRRSKEQVAADLPEKTEQVVELELEPRHRRVYQRYLQRERQKVLGLLGDLNKNRFEIFRSLTLLRQASLHVGLVDPDHAKVPSTKLDALMEQLADIVAGGHRTLVFSQFTRFLGEARARLAAAGIDYCYLDGRTRDRPKVLREFKSGTAPVFLISLKAGGVGLNLTEADYCILLDPWWNPATEAQAVDRVHRIGQERNVMVYRLVAKDTIEEKVMALKARKAALFSSIMSDGGVGSAQLTAADIRGLLE